MQNGLPQREAAGRRNNEEIPVEVQSQDFSEGFFVHMYLCGMVRTEIGRRVNLNLNRLPDKHGH